MEEFGSNWVYQLTATLLLKYCLFLGAVDNRVEDHA